MTTLVTGATGLIGSAIVRALLQRGEDVRVLVRAGSNRRNVDGLDIDMAVGDLRDAGSLRGALTGCRALYHAAADYRLWAPKTSELYETNVEGTGSLMRLAAEGGVERIVYTSSVATIGPRADGSPSDESMTLSASDIVSHYKRSKYLAEQEVRRLAREERVPVVIVNPATVIGPGDVRPTPSGRIIAHAVRGKIPAYVDTGLNVVHVDDVASGHLLAFQHGELGERYILGGENMMLREILAEVARLVGRSPPKVRLSPGVVMPVAYAVEAAARVLGMRSEPLITVEGVRMAKRRMFFTSDRARQALGYAPRPAREALADAVRWFAGNAAPGTGR